MSTVTDDVLAVADDIAARALKNRWEATLISVNEIMVLAEAYRAVREASPSADHGEAAQ